jgi:hypothetical protein
MSKRVMLSDVDRYLYELQAYKLGDVPLSRKRGAELLAGSISRFNKTEPAKSELVQFLCSQMSDFSVERNPTSNTAIVKGYAFVPTTIISYRGMHDSAELDRVCTIRGSYEEFSSNMCVQTGLLVAYEETFDLPVEFHVSRFRSHKDDVGHVSYYGKFGYTEVIKDESIDRKLEIHSGWERAKDPVVMPKSELCVSGFAGIPESKHTIDNRV